MNNEPEHYNLKVGHNKNYKLRFPVAERFLRDTMPDTIRWYPEYAWGIQNNKGTWIGFAGLFNFGWFTELGSLWIRDDCRGMGLSEHLTTARVDYILDRKDLFKNQIFISRINHNWSPKILMNLGFKKANFTDWDNDHILYAKREDLIRTNKAVWKGFGDDFHAKWSDTTD